ncbi:MAG: hypothetical protein B7Z80_15315 [Rhodospirillales bacterium 20-64-7]|nr:MAG: hypothetical protein B7Z80_15315 [Rhodospirillales bacterium 20-64-7]HQT78433.1 PIG-L family deacetylase [Rhodopila sp.]
MSQPCPTVHPPRRLARTRRAILIGAANLLAVTVHAADPQPAANRLRIVVVGGHPGDPEYGCGGTIARYTDLGHEVTLLYLNRGETSCPETDPAHGSTMRTHEALAACAILGARARFAGQCNAHAIVDMPHYEAFARLLNELAPDVVFNQWPIDNHPDHRAISNLTYQAWLRMHRVPALYFYEVSDGEDTLMFQPTDYVDITALEARKRRACYAHASQDPNHYYPLQSQVARFRGLEAGCQQAEAFIRHARSRRGLLP